MRSITLPSTTLIFCSSLILLNVRGCYCATQESPSYRTPHGWVANADGSAHVHHGTDGTTMLLAPRVATAVIGGPGIQFRGVREHQTPIPGSPVAGPGEYNRIDYVGAPPPHTPNINLWSRSSEVGKFQGGKLKGYEHTTTYMSFEDRKHKMTQLAAGERGNTAPPGLEALRVDLKQPFQKQAIKVQERLKAAEEKRRAQEADPHGINKMLADHEASRKAEANRLQQLNAEVAKSQSNVVKRQRKKDAKKRSELRKTEEKRENARPTGKDGRGITNNAAQMARLYPAVDAGARHALPNVIKNPTTDAARQHNLQVKDDRATLRKNAAAARGEISANLKAPLSKIPSARPVSEEVLLSRIVTGKGPASSKRGGLLHSSSTGILDKMRTSQHASTQVEPMRPTHSFHLL